MTSNADFASVQASRNRDPGQRITNKLKLLTELKARGVWLVDASIGSLYRQGQSKPPQQVRERVLRKSWDDYIRSVLREASPDAILCVGLGVGRALESRLNQLGVPWDAVPQPQARLSSAERFEIFETYFRLSDDPSGIQRLGRRWLRGPSRA